MREQDTGGPAFPQDGGLGDPGMTFLDAAALASLRGFRSRDTLADSERIAEWAYNDATAMVAEKRRREKGGE